MPYHKNHALKVISINTLHFCISAHHGCCWNSCEVFYNKSDYTAQSPIFHIYNYYDTQDAEQQWVFNSSQKAANLHQIQDDYWRSISTYQLIEMLPGDLSIRICLVHCTVVNDTELLYISHSKWNKMTQAATLILIRLKKSGSSSQITTAKGWLIELRFNVPLDTI